MTALSDVVVVGASAAGLTAAETLRREGYSGRLTMVGEEAHAPYDRPPLSKQVLRGTWEPARVALRGEDALAGLDVEWLLGRTATELDTGARKVTLSDGQVLGYDGLVIATGVAPRPLPQGHELAGVHLLRTLDDALALRQGLLAAKSVVVIGAGFLGAEAAAAARELGLAVTMVDPLPAPMIRQLGARMGELLAALHVRHGVDLRTGIGVTGLVGEEGRVTKVELDDGTVVPADVVLVAIGSVPAVGWLAGSGLSLGNGVECDELCQAAPGVVAAGDVASWAHPDLGRVRVEHRMNATEQGTAAAKTLLGKGSPFLPVPYFWTDQYDVKIQAYGLPSQDAEFEVVAGDPAEGRFAALYGVGGHVTAALSWNLPKEARALRRHVVQRTPWQEALSVS
ncbi:MAG: FAD-dependent pyridine nucleotide-disulfide oxidoreductase [Amycolatopsis sp.]|uniref:NAD(P)/FAD-dependent oxidoreductase n=1 Tax=Amycolatopsis sp. TaxID=37632 RepID=UPI00260775F9|nr:FAD-dependent oxidoreductase [Amycolatopsis sp.]MCU1679836.1 FAD-dependent pyridine nucleotide-disulfide oxidoreductase [Amycolatopsis sp.]